MFGPFRRSVRSPAPPPSKKNPASPPLDFLNALVEALTEGVLAVDPQRRVLLANPALTELLNCPASQANGKPVWEVLRHRELGDLLDRVFASGQGEKRELDFGSGQERLYEVSAYPIRPEDTRPGIVLTFRDITQNRRHDALRKEFVANVSHELKTPLTALSAALETLLNGALEDPDHARDFLQTAQDQTARLQRLIDDLLTLSRLERPGASPAPASCYLEEVARRVARALQPLAEKAEVSLVCEMEKGPLEVALTTDEVTQILFNLLDNAVKFNRPRGRAVLRVEPEEGEVRVEVNDTGMGIAPEDQPRVFERFFRADRARSTPGSGLGLSIVKHLVESRGGRLSVTSVPSEGTRFTVRLPRSRTPSKNASRSDPEGRPR